MNLGSSEPRAPMASDEPAEPAADEVHHFDFVALDDGVVS